MNLKRRALAAGIHASASAAIATAVAFVGLGLMYPGVYRQLAGGTELFFLICGVDVVMGPLLTAVVFSEGKRMRELRRDVSVIVILQVAALCYGLYVLAAARPVALVFEVDRFRVVSKADVLDRELPQAAEGLRALPWTGPRLLAARMASDAERLDAIETALTGYDIGQRPTFWQPYDLSRASAFARAHPAEMILRQLGDRRAEVERELKSNGLDAQGARFLPLQSRQAGWVVWLDAAGTPKLIQRYPSIA
jgi:hypothetical protein